MDVKEHGDMAAALIEQDLIAGAALELHRGLKKIRDTTDIVYLIFSAKAKLELMCRGTEEGEWLRIEQFHLHDSMLRFKCVGSEEWQECPISEFWHKAMFRW